MIRARAGLLLLCLAACGCPGPVPGDGPTASTAPVASVDSAAHGGFDEKRAWADLRTLCGFGSRGHAQPGWEQAQAYIQKQLGQTGVEPRALSFTYPGAKKPLVNICARYPGQRPDVWVLIGSHYDTRLWADQDRRPSMRDHPIEGADDGGSGTAVLLELARVLGKTPPPVGVELVFFDGEDYGHRGTKDYMLGSKDMASRFDALFPEGRPAAAVILDMVGDLDLRFLREEHAEDQCRWLNDVLWDAAQRLGYGEHFAKERLGVWDDHTELADLGIPSTLLIDFSYPFWHTVDDTLDKCSPRSLGITGEVLLEALKDQRLIEHAPQGG